MSQVRCTLWWWLPFALGACGLDIDGNGKRVDEKRQLSGFVEIDNRSAFDVQVEPGESDTVSVSVDENLLGALETRVVGETLIIDSHENIGRTVLGPHVTVSAPRLRSAKLSGSGRLDLLAFAQDEPLELVLAGSGDLYCEGEAPAFVAELSGSGALRIAGSTQRIELDLDGSGTLDARACVAEEGSIDLDGSGDVRATIHGPVEIALSGSGDINLYGGADIVHRAGHGSGRVREH
jgi:hypothetical protein